MNALVSFDRVFEVLDLVPMIGDAKDAETVAGPASVEFRGCLVQLPDCAMRSRWRAWNRLPRSTNGQVARSCTM